MALVTQALLAQNERVCVIGPGGVGKCLSVWKAAVVEHGARVAQGSSVVTFRRQAFHTQGWRLLAL